MIVSGAAAAVSFAAIAAFGQQGKQDVSAMHIDKDLKQKIGACEYSASVHGTITPVKNQSAGKAKSEPVVDPNLMVTAQVTCPNAEAAKLTDNVMATGPLTNGQLEQAIERRASVVMESAKGRCVYVPNFTLANDALNLTSVNHDCAKPSK
jgi:hypothetical protein